MKWDAIHMDGFYRCGIENLSAKQLAVSKVPDEFVIAIWVGFASRGGKKYMAVHVFNRSSRHILLSSKDKDYGDFGRVCAMTAHNMDGHPEARITERMEDICVVIDLPQRVTQHSVAHAVEGFYTQNFTNVTITNVYYKVSKEAIPLVEALEGENK